MSLGFGVLSGDLEGFLEGVCKDSLDKGSTRAPVRDLALRGLL